MRPGMQHTWLIGMESEMPCLKPRHALLSQVCPRGTANLALDFHASLTDVAVPVGRYHSPGEQVPLAPGALFFSLSFIKYSFGKVA